MSRSPLGWIRIGAIALAIMLTAGFAVGSLTRTGAKTGAHTASQTTTRGVSGGGSVDAFRGAAEPVPAVENVPAIAGAPAGSVAAPDSSLGALTVPAIGDNVIKTAEISLEVRRNGVDGAFNRVVAIATTFGGYVLSSGQGGPGPVVPLGKAEDLRSLPAQPLPVTSGSDDSDTADVV